MKLEGMALVLDAMTSAPWFQDTRDRRYVRLVNGQTVVSTNTEGDAAGLVLLHKTRYKALNLARSVEALREAAEVWYSQVALSSREGRVARHLLTVAIDKCICVLQELES